ncbi:MAG: tripartite tricarboxylate transporter substrate binding protein [Armatimonadota bacterium]|nr:tripartite tricarboxylate transporter substrate binding protein [Armatimonadota bacterium]MDR7386568.1 tripartite tricarboxylate transporter substrate binding protein [Armatimonadota bacterium]MDR7389928.1 tripartite tricarboxylate transporter substrate binding protein [Armatimonadota bacterium]MDR7393891.1 tripartite tricarboxylate transporter substrate binding protein [Armatimonadota bacterium]MDR7395747.1 tripartite tricarboxylate transporter substrate binding protein [Armatimonadota bact
MRGTWRGVLTAVLAAGLALCLVWAAAGAPSAYPTRPITWLVAFAPGGQSDVEVRRVQPHLEKLLGVRILVEYRTGGGGAVGWSELARARPDGYTVGGLVMPHMVIQTLLRGAEAGYRLDQIRSIAWTVAAPNALMVRKDSPFRTLRDFVEYAKANPGKLAVGGVERLSPSDLSLAQFMQAAGIRLTYVPIAGGAGPVMTSLMGGHVDAATTAASHGIRYKDQVRILAVSGKQRLKAAPDVPTFSEFGYNVTVETSWGVGAPAGVPAEVVTRLSQALLQVMRMPEIRKAVEEEGLTPLYYGPAESQAYVNRLVATYRDLVQLLR